MIWPFKCRHQARLLVVEKEATTAPIDRDFNEVTYHLFCLACSSKVEIKHASMVGGVSGFLSRKDLETKP